MKNKRHTQKETPLIKGKDMVRRALRLAFSSFVILSSSFLLSACTDLIYDDRSDCDSGVYLSFRYDYNLQRADMFADHVGGITVYVFDAQGNYVTRQSEANTPGHEPLRQKDYHMHLDLPAGEYQFVAFAMQQDVDGTQQTDGDSRARFRINTPENGGTMQDLSVLLDHSADGTVSHGGLPLDTLWHARSVHTVKTSTFYAVSDTLSLVRNTKQLHVSLRELSQNKEQPMDVADYDFRITDRNLHLLWDNTVDESLPALYTPYATWNTYDKEGTTEGATAHAEFMTSRILWHESARDDARLTVTHRDTGKEVINVNLPDLLAQLRGAAEYRYAEQEFLDRGYDYRLTFFLNEGKLVEVKIEISVLAWAVRISYTDL